MARIAQDFLHWAFFDDAACVHYLYARGDLRYYTEIVGDENHGQAQIALEVHEEFEDLFLYRDVERGGWLVGDQDAWTGGKRHRDHGALTKAAGKLMWILASAQFGIRDGGAFECGYGTAMSIGCAHARFVDADGFFDLRAYAHYRIERGHWLLKNHGNFAAADGADLLAVGNREIGAARGSRCRVSRGAEVAVAARMQPGFADAARAGRSESHEGEDEHRFAGAGFADDAKRFAGSERERDIVDRADPAALRRQFDGQAAHIEQRIHALIIE